MVLVPRRPETHPPSTSNLIFRVKASDKWKEGTYVSCISEFVVSEKERYSIYEIYEWKKVE